MAVSTVKVAKNYRRATVSFTALRWLVRGLFFLLFRVKVTGLENLPKSGSYIVASNHLSWIDPFLLLVYMPATPRIYFIAAREDVYHPAWRRIFTERVGGVIAIERDNRLAGREASQKVAEVLEGGGVLGIFPEGDVSGIETGKILPLKKGMGYFAASAGVPIVPVAFSGTKELWVGRRIKMIVGQPVAARTGGKQVAHEQTEAVATELRRTLPPPAPVTNGPKPLRKFFTRLFTQEEKEHPVPE